MSATLLLNFVFLFAQQQGATDPQPTLPSTPALRPASPVRRVEGTAAAGVLHPRLDIVEAGTEDIDGLATTLRTDPYDPRLPTGFQRVYRVPGSDTLFMRGNGALFAIFDASTYRPNGNGASASLPPGTVFHIGMPTVATTRSMRFGTGASPNELPRANVDTKGEVVPQRDRMHASDARIDPRVATSLQTSRKQFTPVPVLQPAPAAGANQESARASEPSAQELRDAGNAETSSLREVAPVDADPYRFLKLGPANVTRG